MTNKQEPRMAAHEQATMLQQRCAAVIPFEDFVKKCASGRRLKIKLGVDPTAPDLHLGHAVVLGKMRNFQDVGHEVIFLIGDFTSRIGDPTGRSKTRPPLTPEQIQENAITYFNQVSKILDPAKTTVRYNAEWLAPISLAEWLKIIAKVTLARLIERDDFAQRLTEQAPIGMHELMYPILQGYDSVALEADVELGGTEQTFNLLMGRHLQELYGQEPQVIMTMPLLVGLDGVQKMSKSLGNHVGLAEAPNSAFGKIMSISDELMMHYFELVLAYTSEQIAILKQAIAQEKQHPMTVKKQLAREIVTRFWSAAEAEAAQQHFEALFQQRDYSQADEAQLPASMAGKSVWIVDLLKTLGAIAGSSEAKRLIESGAVSIDDVPVTEFKATVVCKTGTVIKVGKRRIYKVI